MRAHLALVLVLSGAALGGCKSGHAEEAKAQLPALSGEPIKKPYEVKDFKPASAEAKASAAGHAVAAAVHGTPAASGGMRLTGSTSARRRSQVAAAASGMVESMLVREGDMVAEGAVIARLDSRMARLQLDQANAALAGGRAQLAGAEREVKRLSALAARNAVPRAELERAETAVDGAKAQVAAHRAAVGMAKRNVDEAVIKAPFAGMIVRRLKSEGEWVSTMPPAPLVELIEVSPLELRVEAPERLLSRLKVGDRFTAQATALGRTFEAHVTRIVADVNPANRSFLVIAEVPNADGTVPPGVFVEVTLGGAAAGAPAKADQADGADRADGADQADGADGAEGSDK